MFGLLLMTAFSESFVKYTYATCKEGAKMPRADWNEMRIYPVTIPTESILKEFNYRISKLTELMKTLCHQISLLRQARDKLLPKLMSGDIEV
jgi:type I restriction enzyme S subunit